MFTRAQEAYHSRIKEITSWDKVVPTLDAKCVIAIPWCEEEACEDDIKERSAKGYVPFFSLALLTFVISLSTFPRSLSLYCPLYRSNTPPLPST